jgi:hypothetical protein
VLETLYFGCELDGRDEGKAGESDKNLIYTVPTTLGYQLTEWLCQALQSECQPTKKPREKGHVHNSQGIAKRSNPTSAYNLHINKGRKGAKTHNTYSMLREEIKPQYHRLGTMAQKAKGRVH